MSLAAYQAAHKVVADALVSIPLCVYERTKARGDVETHEHRVARTLRDPHPNSTYPTYMDAQCRDLMGGESFSRIILSRGRVYLEHLPSYAVRVGVFKGGPRAGELAYELMNGSERTVLLREEVLHVPWMSVNGVSGVSAMLYHHAVVRLGLSIEDFCEGFFLRGHNGGWLKLQEKHRNLPDSTKNDMAVTFGESIGPASNEKIAWLEEGIEFDTLDNAKPEDAQLLATRRHNIGDIARIMNIPIHKLKVIEGQTNTNLLEGERDFVRNTLLPISARFCAEKNRKLFTLKERDRFYIAHDFRELLRGDGLNEAKVDALDRQNGVKSPNDIRRQRRLPLIPAELGGDDYSPSLAPANNFGMGPAGETKGAPAQKAASFGPLFEAAAKSVNARFKKARKQFLGDPGSLNRLAEFGNKTFAPVLFAMGETFGHGERSAQVAQLTVRKVLEKAALGQTVTGLELAEAAGQVFSE